MRQLVVEGVPFRETDEYAAMLSDLETYGRTRRRGLASREEVDRYFEGILALAERIRTEGYRRTYRTTREGAVAPDEITVRIGRDGAFLKCRKGTHRLALARVLGIPSVPVVVDLFHWDWVLGCRQRYGRPARASVEQALRDLARGAPPRGPGLKNPHE